MLADSLLLRICRRTKLRTPSRHMSLSDLIKKAVTNTQAAQTNNQSASTTNVVQSSAGKPTLNVAVGKGYVKSDKTAKLLGDMIRKGSVTQV